LLTVIKHIQNRHSLVSCYLTLPSTANPHVDRLWEAGPESADDSTGSRYAWLTCTSQNNKRIVYKKKIAIAVAADE